MSGEAVGAGLADAITTVRAELERAIAASGRSSPGTPSRRGPPRSGAELFPGNEAVEDPRIIRVVEHHEPAVGQASSQLFSRSAPIMLSCPVEAPSTAHTERPWPQ